MLITHGVCKEVQTKNHAPEALLTNPYPWSRTPKPQRLTWARYCLDPKYNTALDPAIAFEVQQLGESYGNRFGARTSGLGCDMRCGTSLSSTIRNKRREGVGFRVVPGI